MRTDRERRIFAEASGPVQAIFLTHTPYHILLACAIASEHHPGRSILVVKQDFLGAPTLLQSLKQWGQSPFLDVLSVEGGYDQYSRTRRLSTARKNIRIIKRLVIGATPRFLYVFNDEQVEAQAALHYARRRNSRVRAVFVEDGSSVYSSCVFPQRSLTKQLARKAILGLWVRYVPVLGTSPWIDEVAALFPDLLRPELRGLPARRLERALVEKLTQRGGFLETYARAFGVQVRDLENLDVLVLVACSEGRHDLSDHAGTVKHLVECLAADGLRVAVKYHPREQLDDYYGLARLGSVTLLPSAVPAELVYFVARQKGLVVVGYASTALLTARWLMDRAQVICLSPPPHEGSDRVLGANMCTLGVIAGRSAQQILELLGDRGAPLRRPRREC